MNLDFKKGKFFIPNPKYEFKDQLKGVPTSRWSSATKSWNYWSTPQSKEVLIIYCENGLLSPTPEAIEELNTLEAYDKVLKSVKGIKEECRVEVDVPLKVELFQHQKKAYKIGITLDKAGLLMEQGTGKTLTSLAIAGHRYFNGEIDKLLVVAPLSTLTSWEEEILKYVDYPVEIKNLPKKKGKKRLNMLKEFGNDDSLQIVLINHQSVWRIYPELKEWGADMIIVDESQRIKNGSAKQSKALHRLGDSTPYKLILTGTPVTQGPLDMWSQFRFLDPNIFGRRFADFKSKYAIMGGFKGYRVVGFRDLEDLKKRVHSISYRIKKEDTEIDLPPITNQYLYASLGNKAKGYYKEMKKNFIVTLDENEGNIKAPIVLTKLLRLQQITGGFLKNEDDKLIQVDNSKMTIMKDLIEDMPDSKKLVIFARFIPEVNAIEEQLKKSGRKVVTLTGKTKDRGGVIGKFTKDKDITVLIAQIQTGGVGLNLQVADTVIFYSVNFSYGDYDQAKARIHRIGQKSNSVNYIHLLIEGTIDEKVIEALNDKKDVAEHIVDNI